MLVLTRIAIRGSAINGFSYDKKKERFSSAFFDMKVEKASDFDIAIAGPALFKLARKEGARIFRANGAFRTGPLEDGEALEPLGLFKIQHELRKFVKGREISFMIYETVEQLERRGTMVAVIGAGKARFETSRPGWTLPSG